MHVDMVDEMFLCGHFCVVYMNPCHFHTGVMVIKPNISVYNELYASIGRTGSYDGADQGFLSAYFNSGCNDAPIFNPVRGQSEEPFSVLHITYNMHALYHFIRGNLDPYRCGPASGYTDHFPVATLGFPVPPIIKPWYFWTPMMGHSDMWHDIRAELSEPDMYVSYFLRLALLLVLWVALRAAMHRTPGLHEEFRVIVALRRAILRIGPSRSSVLVGVLLMMLSARFGLFVAPAIMRPTMGLSLYFVGHVIALYALARMAANIFFNITSSPIAPSVATRDLGFVMGALVLLFTMQIWRTYLFELLLGYGLHTVIVCFVIAMAGVLGSHVYLVLHIARRSPLFPHLHV